MTDNKRQEVGDTVTLIRTINEVNTRLQTLLQTVTILNEAVIGMRADIHNYEMAHETAREYRTRMEKQTLTQEVKIKQQTLETLEKGAIDTEEKVKRIVAATLPGAVDAEMKKNRSWYERIDWDDIKQSAVKAVIVWGAVAFAGGLIAFLWFFILEYINR